MCSASSKSRCFRRYGTTTDPSVNIASRKAVLAAETGGTGQDGENKTGKNAFHELDQQGRFAA
jgi:hypothetical protein